MNDYREHVRAAIQATVFHSPTTYSWFGKRSQHFPPSVRRALTPETARDYLLFALQSQLYNDFYCPGFAQSTGQRDVGHPASGRTPFVEALGAANSGSGYWTAGWKVREDAGREILVHRRGISLRVRPEECLTAPNGAFEPGMMVSLRFPKEFLALSPGFYMALGDEELVHEEAQTVVRWYWNLTAPGAVRFLRKATLMLNRAHLPYKLKVLNDPAQFTRRDAVVLYIRKADYSAVSQVLAEIYPEVAADLKPGIPVFTKLLAPGVGLAEDPGPGESFGLHRCRLLAEAMINAYEQGKKSVAERLEEVEVGFAKEGISLDAPFLNPGSRDEYSFPLRLPRQTQESWDLSQQELDGAAFLKTAAEIGNRLSQEAVWYQGRCNWLGVEPEGYLLASGLTRMVCKALGPELYQGTSGVALFLAALYSATGDTTARDTALGAIRQALSNIDAVPPPVRFGLYTGWSGIAFSAARVGVLLREEELLGAALHLLQRLARESQDEREFDLLSGVAGAVAAFVVLHDILHEASLLDFAARLGDELLNAADKSQTGYSWRSPSFPEQPNLTGFSHGAAGIGYALLELFHATGTQSYRHAAEQAFSYEHHWFDEETGNWPDLRSERGRDRHPRAPLSFSTAWCHGAPGIALARLRAYQLLKDDRYKAEARTALQTTHQTVETSLRAKIGTYSLCHGLAGNADILLQGFQMLGEAQGNQAILARQVACAGIERYVQPGHEWPCGPGGETPSLMIGLAGIGYFYLRLYDPTLPSLLMLQRESF